MFPLYNEDRQKARLRFRKEFSMKMRYATPLEAWIHAGGDPLVRNWNTLTAKGSFWQGSLWQAFRLAFGAQL